jgi:type IV secretion system protein TrbL
MIPTPDSVGGLTKALGWLAGQAGLSPTDVAMAPIKALASGLTDAVGQMLATFGTLWIRLNVPNVWTGGTTSGTVEFLHTQLAPVVGMLAVGGIIIGAAKLAWSQRAQQGQNLVEGILLLVLVTGCGVPMIGMLTSGADAWSQSIIDNATNGTDFGRNIASMLALAGPRLAPVLVITFGIIALFVSGVMTCLLLFRAAMLVMLAGFLPIAAAMTTTTYGRELMRKYASWVIAFVAWKPVAALIYATAFKLIGTHDLDATGAASVLIGVTVMTMGVLALPALMRFLVPAVAALHTGSPAAASMAAATAMPPGAKALHRAHYVATGAGVVAGAAGPSGARNAPAASPSASTAPATAPATGGRPRGTDGQ